MLRSRLAGAGVGPALLHDLAGHQNGASGTYEGLLPADDVAAFVPDFDGDSVLDPLTVFVLALIGAAVERGDIGTGLKVPALGFGDDANDASGVKRHWMEKDGEDLDGPLSPRAKPVVSLAQNDRFDKQNGVACGNQRFPPLSSSSHIHKGSGPFFVRCLVNASVAMGVEAIRSLEQKAPLGCLQRGGIATRSGFSRD